MNKWEQIPINPDMARFHPNLDFWRIGNKIVAGTEAPYWVGYELNVMFKIIFINFFRWKI